MPKTTLSTLEFIPIRLVRRGFEVTSAWCAAASAARSELAPAALAKTACDTYCVSAASSCSAAWAWGRECVSSRAQAEAEAEHTVAG